MLLKRIFMGIAAFLFVMAPGLALADVWFSNPLYHTYGNTAAYTADAFLQLAHVMGQNSFKGMFLAFTTIGIFVGGCWALYSQFRGMNFSVGPWVQWGGTVILGMGIFLSYINPVTDLYFIDETGNAQAVAPDVPDGIVNIALIMNKIETGVIDVMNIGITGLTYEEMAGGIAYSLVAKLFTGEMSTQVLPMSVRTSLVNYWNDCAVYEATRPGGTLTPEDFANARDQSLKSAWAKGAKPGVLTTYVTGAGNKVSISCQEAWQGDIAAGIPGLNNELSADMATRYVRDQCKSLGFNEAGDQRVSGLAGVVANISVCREIAQKSFSALMSANALSSDIPDRFNDVAWNKAMMTAIHDAASTGDPGKVVQLTGNTQIMSGGLGMGIMAGEWMPIIRTMVLSVFLGVTPFVLIFLPTPLLGKVLSFVCGGMMFIAAWGVCDAVMSQMTMQYAFTNLRTIGADGINYTNMIQVPDHLGKIMGMLGYLRTSAIMFAALITTMLFKFGGHALSSLSGNISGIISGAGASGGAAALTPQGQAATLASTVSVPASMTGYRDTISTMGGYSNTVTGMGNSQSVGMISSMEGARARIDQQGGLSGVKNTAFTNASMSAAKEQGSAEMATFIGLDEATHAAKLEGKMSVGSTVNAKRGFDTAKNKNMSEEEGVMIAARGAAVNSAENFGKGSQWKDDKEAIDSGLTIGREATAEVKAKAKASIDMAGGDINALGRYFDLTTGSLVRFNQREKLSTGESLASLPGEEADRAADNSGGRKAGAMMPVRVFKSPQESFDVALHEGEESAAASVAAEKKRRNAAIKRSSLSGEPVSESDIAVMVGTAEGGMKQAERIGSAEQVKRIAPGGNIDSLTEAIGTRTGAIATRSKVSAVSRYHSADEAGDAGGVQGAKQFAQTSAELDQYGSEGQAVKTVRKKVRLQVEQEITKHDAIGNESSNVASGHNLGLSDASDMISTGEAFVGRVKANDGFAKTTAKKTAQKELDMQRSLDTSESMIDAFDGIDPAAAASAKTATLSATTSFNQTLANDMGLAASRGDKVGVKSALGYMAANANSDNASMAEGAIAAASNIRGTNSREAAKIMAEAFNEAYSTHLTGDDVYGNSSLSFGKDGGHFDLVSGNADSQLTNRRASLKKLQNGQSAVMAQSTTKDAESGELMTVSNTGGESTHASINHTVVDGGYQNRAPLSAAAETLSHAAKEHYGEDSWQAKAADFINMTWGDVKGVAGEVMTVRHAVGSHKQGSKGAKSDSPKPTPPSSGPADGYRNAPSSADLPSDYYIP